MNLSGNFKNFELSKLLQLLAMDNATGVLQLKNSKDNIEIFLKKEALSMLVTPVTVSLSV